MQDREPDPDREGILGHFVPRTGTEPWTARSALRMRLVLAVVFTPLFIAAAILFWFWTVSVGPQDTPSDGSLRTLAWICTALAAFAVVDLLVVLRRISRARRARRGGQG